MHSTVPTKLRVPDVGARLVFRPTLMRLLDEGLAHKVTLVSAPAGYGKTTSVAMWIRALGDPSFGPPHPEIGVEAKKAWYSLDREDDDVDIFCARFVAAIDAALPGALRAVAIGSALQMPPVSDYANTLADAILKLPRPVILVLDDYHLITDSGIHTLLVHLIQYASAKLHLVIVARHDPPLRVARLRAQHQVTEVRAADLRMTAQEATKLLEISLPQRPSAELVAELLARTEGWVAGL